MFEFLKKKETYPNLTDKYDTILRRDLSVNANYAHTFVTNRGDQLSSSEFNIRKANETGNISSLLKSIIIDYGYEYFTLITVCTSMYFHELKVGKWVSDEEELVAVALMIKLKHITSRMDPGFSNWLLKNFDTKWPDILETVFQDAFSSHHSTMDKDAYFSQVVAYNKSNQPAKAIEVLQQVVRIDPNDKRAWDMLGSLYDDKGQTAKAIEAWQQVVRIDPNEDVAWRMLGERYLQSNQTAKAIEALQQATRIDPDSLFARFLLEKANKEFISNRQSG